MMPIVLNNVIPAPLQEQFPARSSQIWATRFEAGAGERIFVQAPSGSGKTTLIHILYGLRQDYSGTATLGGKDLKQTDPATTAEIRSGELSIIFQDMRLFPNLTAIENLELKRTLTHTVTSEEAAAWMERLGLGHKKETPGAHLSFGEQQRVAIIRALLQPFAWLIMDEPFSHLDAGNTQKAIQLINEVCDRNEAGFILADLDDNQYFNYTRTLRL